MRVFSASNIFASWDSSRKAAMGAVVCSGSMVGALESALFPNGRDGLRDPSRNQIGMAVLKTCIIVGQSANVTGGEYALNKCQNPEL